MPLGLGLARIVLVVPVMPAVDAEMMLIKNEHARRMAKKENPDE